MNKMASIAITTALAATALGASASAASAYAWVPPSTAFTGTNVGSHSFNVGGLTVGCSGKTLTGTTPASGAQVRGRPAYSGCQMTIAGLNFPVLITLNSDWGITVTGGTGPFTGRVSILAPPSGHAVTIEAPSINCLLYFDAAGNGSLSSVTITNTSSPTAVDHSYNLTGITYTSNSMCPGVPASGTNASYIGTERVPGITVTN